jgi:hypothetical protein
MNQYLDDIFDAIYDENKDEYGEMYSSVYKYECRNMCNTLDDMIRILMTYFTINESDVAKLIVLSEQRHIGNDLEIDYNKLEKVSENILLSILC